MKYQKNKKMRLISLLLTIVMVAGGVPGGLLKPIVAEAEPYVPDAPTYGQASVIYFSEAETNFVGGIALDGAGKVWTWGYNSNGQLGIGAPTATYAGGMMRIPFFVDNNINVVHISGGFHTNFALTDDGELYAWGRGTNGQMANGTETGENHVPLKVTTLPAGISIKKVAVGTGGTSGECCVFLLCEDGRIFAWGSGYNNRIPGVGNENVSVAKEVTEYFTDVLPAGVKIVDIELGDRHGIALDSTGQIYTWGPNGAGQLGLGDTAVRTTPTLVTAFSGTSIKDISAFHDTTMAVTVDGDAYIWGSVFEASGTATSYTSVGGDTIYYHSGYIERNYRTPKLVEFDLSSSPYNDTAPKVAFATAGRYVNYVTDVYGRVWYFGRNVSYGFATDGPLFNNDNGGKYNTGVTDATLLRTLGDGDSQGYTYHMKAPVFTGATTTDAFSSQYNSYSLYGQWSSMSDGLHPTIYDKKYMVTTIEGNPSYPDRHTYDYPLDAQGRRLVYVIRRETASLPYTYSGDFYVAQAGYIGPWCINNSGTTELPTGVSAETSVPVVKESERSWIGLSVNLDTFDYTGRQLNETPYITGISNNSSQVLYIDDSGNLYKQSLDGSGSIAWGWDYTKYEYGTASNNATEGLYNFYSYEIIYMRGSPNVPTTDVSVEKPATKAYLVEDEMGRTPEDTVTITAKVPGTVINNQMNLRLDPELTELRYVFIPYDTTDAFFNITHFTDADFEAAFTSGKYQAEDFLEAGNTYKEGEYTFNVNVGENGKIWVLSADFAYTRTQKQRTEYLVDYFYTPLEIMHCGLEIEDPTGEFIYAPTDDNVVKEQKVYSPEYTDTSPYYGIPLDVNGNVLPDPSFDYDMVTVSAYDELPGGLSEIWGWYEPQIESVDIVLDSTDYFVYEGGVQVPFIHTFYYVNIGEAIVNADKSVSDANGDGKASPGEILTYTITMTNEGNIPAVGVTVQDTLSAMMPHIYNPSTGTVTVDNDGTVTAKTVADLMDGFEIASIGVGATVTLTFSVTVRADMDVNTVTQLSNTVTVGGTTIPAVTIQTGDVEITGSKSVADQNSDGRAAPGEVLTYTITVNNEGTVTAVNVPVQDTLSEIISYIDDPGAGTVAINNDGVASTMTVSDLMAGFNIASIGVSKTVTLVFDVTVKADLDVLTVTQLRNTATMGGVTPQPAVILTGDAFITGEKSVTDTNGDGKASPDEVLTYVITIKNEGTVAALAVPVQDTLSGLLAYIDDPAAETLDVNNDGVLSAMTVADLMAGFDIASIGAGKTVTLVFDVTVKLDLDVDAVTQLSNTATVDNIALPEVTIPTGDAEITGSISVEDANGDGKASPGEVLTYTITVNNEGNVMAVDVPVQDTLDEILEHIEEPDGGEVIIDTAGEGYAVMVSELMTGIEIASIDVGETVTLAFDVTVKADLDVNTVKQLVNTATMGGITPPPAIIATGDAFITGNKSVADTNGDGRASPGEVLTYTINVKNEGTITAQDVPVQDTLSGLLAYINDPATGIVTVDNDGAMSAMTITDLMAGFDIASIDAGKTVTLTFSVTVRTDLDVNTVTQLINTATMGGITPPPAVIQTGDASIASAKSVEDTNGDGKASPGEVLTYQITVRNDGSIAAKNVMIQDTMSEMLDYIEEPDENIVIIMIEGVTADPKTVADLINGIVIPEIGAGVTVTLSFSVTVIKDLDTGAVKQLKNTAMVNGNETKAEIMTFKAEMPDDFSKAASIKEYWLGWEGQTVDYTIGFTLPEDLSTLDNFRIVDKIPDGLIFTGKASLTIGDKPDDKADSGDDESGEAPDIDGETPDIEDDESGETPDIDDDELGDLPDIDDSIPDELNLIISTALLNGGDYVQLKLRFETTSDASGIITNTAELYYTLTGEDEEFAGDANVDIVPAYFDDGGNPASVILRARKIVSGGDAVIVAGQFSFAVYDESGKQVGTATNDAAGDVAFQPIIIKRPGTYTYTMKETMTSGGGWVADATVYTVPVTVTSGSRGLVATIKYPNDTTPTFHNQYRSGTATFEISKTLLNENGTTAETGEIFWVILYVREGMDWLQIGRYAVPANSGSTIIPDLDSGKVYQLVELSSNWYEIRSQVVTMGGDILGTSEKPAVAISIPALTQRITVEILLRNEQTGEVDGQTFGGEPEENPTMIIIDEEVPLAMFMEDHSAYIVGYPDGNVRPEQNITRAEVATVFFRLMTSDLRSANWAQQNMFPDVGEASWYNNAVSVMNAMGIVNGYPDGTFRPNAPITRAELATIAARFARATWMMPINVRSFSDVRGHWAQNDIEYAAAIGWIAGYPDGTYKPDKPITRAEFMTLVNRMLERVPETVDDLLHDRMIRWEDNADPDMWYYLAVQEATNSHIPEYKAGRIVPGLSFEYESWVEITQNRDWVQYEREWSTSYAG